MSSLILLVFYALILLLLLLGIGHCVYDILSLGASVNGDFARGIQPEDRE